MVGFITGADRSQTILLPECLDNYIDRDNPVRVVDAFVEMLDLGSLGFCIKPEATGQPGYHSGLMLRIYLYGFLDQEQSSRRLERECRRNLELIRAMRVVTDLMPVPLSNCHCPFTRPRQALIEANRQNFEMSVRNK